MCRRTGSSSETKSLARSSETMQGAHVPDMHPSPNVEQLKGDLVGCSVLHVHECLSSLCKHVSGCPGLITSAWGRASSNGSPLRLCHSLWDRQWLPHFPRGKLEIALCARCARKSRLHVCQIAISHQCHQQKKKKKSVATTTIRPPLFWFDDFNFPN